MAVTALKNCPTRYSAVSFGRGFIKNRPTQYINKKYKIINKKQIYLSKNLVQKKKIQLNNFRAFLKSNFYEKLEIKQ